MTSRIFKREARLGARETPSEFDQPPEDGFIQIGRALKTEVKSMRLFAKLAPETFVLLAEVGRLSTPAFDGVVLDDQREVIANFSLKTLTTEKADDEADRALRRMERYGSVQHWSKSLRKAILQNVDGELPRFITLFGAERIATFDWIFENYAKMTRYFAPGSGRPNWLLLDLTALPVLSPGRISEIAFVTTQGKPGRYVLLLNGDKLYTIESGAWKSQDVPCAVTL